MAKKSQLILIAFFILFYSCVPKDATFLITEDAVGLLTKGTSAKTLESLFANDSVVKDTTDFKIGNGINSIWVYEKGGKPLLKFTPNTDSLETINHVQVLDHRYLTENGIGLTSTFKDIQKHYEIKKIATTLKSVVIFPKGSNLYFTIDKQELPANLRFVNKEIEAVQIPDEAKIKYLMIGWEE